MPGLSCDRCACSAPSGNVAHFEEAAAVDEGVEAERAEDGLAPAPNSTVSIPRFFFENSSISRSRFLSRLFGHDQECSGKSHGDCAHGFKLPDHPHIRDISLDTLRLKIQIETLFLINILVVGDAAWQLGRGGTEARD